MEIDNLKLPGFVIQDLFRNSLVDFADDVKPATINTSKEISYFGGNRQHIVLLVNNPDAAFVNDQQLTFLSGILNACKLTLEDVGIVNIASADGITYKKISEALSPVIVLMFGVSQDAIQLPFVMPEFQRQTYNNSVYVTAPSLTELENDKDLKRKLWILLQQIFSL